MSEIDVIKKALHDELCSDCPGGNSLDPCPPQVIEKNWASLAIKVRDDLRRAGYLRRRIIPADEAGTDWAKVLLVRITDQMQYLADALHAANKLLLEVANAQAELARRVSLIRSPEEEHVEAALTPERSGGTVTRPPAHAGAPGTTHCGSWLRIYPAQKLGITRLVCTLEPGHPGDHFNKFHDRHWPRRGR